MKLIILTTPQDEKILINLEFVDLIYTDKDGDTCVGYYDGTYQKVKESISDIYNLI